MSCCKWVGGGTCLPLVGLPFSENIYNRETDFTKDMNMDGPSEERVKYGSSGQGVTFSEKEGDRLNKREGKYG